jgi:hypothetical protein
MHQGHFLHLIQQYVINFMSRSVTTSSWWSGECSKHLLYVFCPFQVIHSYSILFNVSQCSEIPFSWLAIINARLTLDQSATHSKYDKRATKTRIVLETWENTLKNECNLPKNWILTPGVLVDITVSEHLEGLDPPDEPP